MTVYRLIAPDWAPHLKPKVLEGVFTNEEVEKYNTQGYNAYSFVNGPSHYDGHRPVDGSIIDLFHWVFVDFDLKSNTYPDKNSFIEAIGQSEITPTRIVDSGNGTHVYWKILSLDAMAFLRFQRRLSRLFNTDEAVSKICQLMRVPSTINQKDPNNPKICETIYETDSVYTAEEFDSLLPPITPQDEAYCKLHHDKTYNLNQDVLIDDSLPPKFGAFLRDNSEAKELFSGETDDRSKNDYRLGHLMFANGFTRDEALSVLVNSAKALKRAPIHRRSYASGIVDKIWTFEETGETESLSKPVSEILRESPNDSLLGDRLVGWKYIDNTDIGFRLGHVMGLVAGSGVGKTTMALNLFMGFVQSNPEYDHFFVPLEQTDREIAARWQIMCGTNKSLHSKVHIISNYDSKGAFRDLSLTQIKDHIIDFQVQTGKKAGCVVIDHIGILCNNNKHGQDEGVKEIAKAMKGFAIETKTFLIMQSQTARSKAGIGDLELDKDAAFGTSIFENFCDYLVTLWQPLKRAYDMGAPTILAYKFCKIRHKKQNVDVLKEDKPYSVFFDPETQLIREITQEEDKAISYWNGVVANKRKSDRKTEVQSYTSIRWNNE